MLFLDGHFYVVHGHYKTQPLFAIKIKTFTCMNVRPIIFQQMLFECSFPQQPANARPYRLNSYVTTGSPTDSKLFALVECGSRFKKTVQSDFRSLSNFDTFCNLPSCANLQRLALLLTLRAILKIVSENCCYHHI